MSAKAESCGRKRSSVAPFDVLFGVFLMKKILLVAAFVALSGGSAFAGGFSSNHALVGNTGFFNTGAIEQGGWGNHNTATVTNLGAFNTGGIEQGGVHNWNSAATFQFGVGNGAFIIQN